MRGRASRRLTATAVSAAMLFGVAGATGTAMAAEQPQQRPVVAPDDAAPLPPVPGLDTVLGPLKGVGPIGPVLGAATELLTAVAKGGLSPEALTKLVDALKDAITKLLAATAPAAPAKPPADLAAPATPPAAANPATPPATSPVPALPLPLPALPGLPKLPVTKAAAHGAPAAADPVADAVAALQKAVEQLVKDLTALNLTGVVADATAAVGALLNLLLSAVLGSGLPGLPKLPLPELPKLPLPLPLPLPVS